MRYHEHHAHREHLDGRENFKIVDLRHRVLDLGTGFEPTCVLEPQR